ncbi:MAG: phosphotransferase family protein, partial [Candidatus Krumholzibacteriia bacterium]
MRDADVPRDDLLPGLGTLLDAQQVARILEQHANGSFGQIESCRVFYVRYKPGTNCLIAISVRRVEESAGSASEVLLCAKCYTESDYVNAARKLDVHRWVERAGIRPVIPLPELRSILYVFPNDSELAGLRLVAHPKRIQRILYESVPSYPQHVWRISDRRLRATTVRYKPEKRAVLRIDTRATHRSSGQHERLCVYMRTYSDDRGRAIHALMHELHAQFQQRPGPVLPRPFVYLADQRCLFMEGLEGDPMLELLDGSIGEDCVTRVATDLVALHRCGAASVPGRSAADLLQDARATESTLVQVAPELRDDVQEILRILDTRRPDSRRAAEGFVHGDFHHGQVLVQSDRVAILDFDRSYVGDPLADVGNFCAHLRVLQAQKRIADAGGLSEAFVGAYAAATGRRPDPAQLGFWTVLGLFQLSVRPFRTLESGWMAKTARVLGEC